MEQYITALAGVFVGGGISFLTAWAMRDREWNLKIWEKFLDRRFTAHEDIVGLALTMRFVCPLGRVDSSGELIRAPQVLMSKEAFDEWLVQFAQKSGPATTWLSTPVTRELNFVQDYFVTLQTQLSELSPAHFPIVGSFIRQDFIDLSSKLEKTAFKFFQADARKLRLNDLTEHHKYPLEETKRRLQKTVLLSRWNEIRLLIESGQA
jgi:hypothetical protein